MRTATAKPETFRAAFASICPKCDRRISAGEVLTRWSDDPTGKRRSVHVTCAGEPETTLTTSEQEEKAEDELLATASSSTGKRSVRSRFAKRDRPCLCCGQEIKKGERTAAWAHRTLAGGMNIWVHEACQDKKPGDVKTAPAVDPQLVETLRSEILDVLTRCTSRDNEIAGQVAGIAPVLKVFAEKLDLLQGADAAHAEVVREMQAQLKDLAARTPRTLEVKIGERAPVVLTGAQHEAFDEVLELAVAREEIFLPGPAGCGKSHLAEQVAKALGLRFEMISCSAGMSEGHLTGRLIPTGDSGKFEYVETGFVRCFEQGGVFLMDEIDAADSNVILVLNSALANGKLALPNRPEKPYAERHPDFVLIAAANTIGTGADRHYVGRNQLDASTLDRFRIGMVPMEYSPAIEHAICTDGELLRRLYAIRDKLAELRSPWFVSTRFIAKAAKMRGMGWSIERIVSKLQVGWPEDLVRRVG